MTIGLGAFLLLWFGFQQLVYHSAGEPIATWLFYYEMPPEHVSPGMVLMVISHDMQNLTHLVSNLTLLLAVGSIIEPRIGGRKLLWLVLPVGLLGTYLANLSVFIHYTWMTAGASGGVLTLLAYTGLECWPSAQEFKAGVELSRQGIERVIHVALLISIPVIPVFEVTVLGQFNSGHTFGLLLGVVMFVWSGPQRCGSVFQPST